jgi:hypothetical protein
MPSHPAVYFSMSIAMGVAGGWLFYLIWRALLPRGYSGEILASIPAQLRGMLGSEEVGDLFRHYRAVLSGITRYAGRNLLAVLVAAVPASALYFLLVELNPTPANEGQRNPFSPLIDDGEFVFFVGAMVGNIVGALVSRVRRGGTA